MVAINCKTISLPKLLSMSPVPQYFRCEFTFFFSHFFVSFWVSFIREFKIISKAVFLVVMLDFDFVIIDNLRRRIFYSQTLAISLQFVSVGFDVLNSNTNTHLKRHFWSKSSFRGAPKTIKKQNILASKLMTKIVYSQKENLEKKIERNWNKYRNVCDAFCLFFFYSASL